MRQKSGPVKESAEKVVKDIRRATRRHFSAEDKIRIVYAARNASWSSWPRTAGRRPPRRRIPARSGFICPLSIRTWRCSLALRPVTH